MKTSSKISFVALGLLVSTFVVAAIVRSRRDEDEDNEAFVVASQNTSEDQPSKSTTASSNTPAPKQKIRKRKRQSQTEKLNDLVPSMRKKVVRMIKKAGEQGINLFLVSAGRKDDEQNELFSRGRTQEELDKAGLSHVKARPHKKKVTNAKAGKSGHNVMRAVDLVQIKGKTLLWKNPNWDKIGKIGESVGLKWGGRWKSFVDRPHFYDYGGKTLAQLWNGFKRTGHYT
jgi:peptidoglycan L-alanyl-D-glutamate endopeptidase CwlK